MEIISTVGSKSFAFPLPIYEKIQIAEAVSKDGEKFSVFVGLDKNLIEQLKKYSLDESDTELQKNTSDLERFGLGEYENWYRKERTPFALVHDAAKTLAAIAWFGPKPLGRKSLKHLNSEELKESETVSNADNWYTISYRCYPRFRGKGLTKKFVAFSMDVYLKNMPNIKLWVGINTENSASEALASGLGFKPVEESSDRKNNWLVMVKD